MKIKSFFHSPVSSIGLGAVVLAALTFGAMSLSTGAANAETAAAPAAGGWFTEAQVARGQQLYETRCATCHGTEIPDGYGMWDGTVQELVDMIKSMGMPADNPGGLPPQQYLDIASYIMHSGGDFAFGEEVLVGSDAVNEAKR